MKKYIIFLMIILLSISCSQKKAGWEGTVEEVNGITVVHNPKEPLYKPDDFSLEEEVSIGEVEGQEEYMFQTIFSLAVSEKGDIYVLDYKANHIKMYDMDGKYIKTIGRSGRGPGEFQVPRYMACTEQDQIMVGDINRISYFSLDGEFLTSTPTLGVVIVQDIDQEGNIFVTEIVREKGVYELNKFDPEFNYLCSFGTSPLSSTQSGKRDPFFSVLRFDIINGDQVLYGYAEEGYTLKIMDKTGKLVKRIEKDTIPVKITQEDIDERIADYSPEMKVEFSSPKYFPPFSRVVADDKGRIYVSTYKKTPDGEKNYFDIFDSKGRYILKVPFKSRPQVIKNNKFYSIEENENGYQCVKRYKMNWNFIP